MSKESLTSPQPMTNLRRLLTLAPILTLTACLGSQAAIKSTLTPPKTTQGSNTATDPLCHSLRVIALSHNDKLTKGTLDQLDSDTKIKRGGCANLR